MDYLEFASQQTRRMALQQARRRLGGNYSGLNLSEKNLHSANLQGANFCQSILRNVDLSGADLGDAILDYADLSEANLSGADLRGASCVGTQFSEADLRGVKLTGPYKELYPIQIESALNGDQVQMDLTTFEQLGWKFVPETSDSSLYLRIKAQFA